MLDPTRDRYNPVIYFKFIFGNMLKVIMCGDKDFDIVKSGRGISGSAFVVHHVASSRATKSFIFAQPISQIPIL